VFIGYQAGYNETTSNNLYISNTCTTTPLIKGNFATSGVTVNGGLSVCTTRNAFVPPLLTTTQRTALSATEGMFVYDLTLHKLTFYNGSTWCCY